MKSSSTGFSLVELLVALGILSISILTIIGLIPVLIEAHQGSKELVRGKNLVEEIMVDLKGLSLGNKKSTLYGIYCYIESVKSGTEMECVFDQEGKILFQPNDVQTKGFYFVKLEVSDTDREMNQLQIRGKMSVRWPEGREKTGKTQYKVFSIPLILAYW